jgi:DNA polymerase I-like protein with 3'-5' exonuclease and polymerase domains
MIVFDLETNGLLPEVSVVHTITTYDTETNTFVTADDQPSIKAVIESLMQAPEICGHNVISYDLPVIEKLYGLRPKGKVIDSMVMTRLLYPDIKVLDFALFREKKFPGNLIGRHSLEAWGHRLGEKKGKFKTDWKIWTPEMSDYCKQDVKVTTALMDRMLAKDAPQAAIDLEHEVQKIIYRQTQYGICFDRDQGEKLYAQLLKEQQELLKEITRHFKPWYVDKGPFVPKRNNKTVGYIKGAECTKVEYTEFNPASRAHIANRLKTLYGWRPEEFTEEGQPKLDEEILRKLPYPVAPALSQYFLVLKRIGQLAEGTEAWLKHADKDNRIHGYVNSNGAVTRRMSHARPNMAQVPRIGSPYGRECRSLFTVPPGKVLVGADASGLELRCLAHYMATYDDGEYVRTVIEGTQEQQTDVHSRTCLALGLNPTQTYTFGGKTGTGRDFAKTFIYAFLYGAGDFKLGSILGKGAAAGRKMRMNFLTSFPALEKLKTNVEGVARRNGTLKSLDGLPMKVRSVHSALNTLLQGAGALIMKVALVSCDVELRVMKGLVPGQHYEFVVNVHDEWQMEVDKDYGHIMGTASVAAIKRAGEKLNLRCPLDGAYKIGQSWAETH